MIALEKGWGKEMKKFTSLCLLLGMLLLSSLSFASTPQEVLNLSAEIVGNGTCVDGKKIVALDVVEENWRIYLLPESGKIVLVDWDGKQAHFGRVKLVGDKLVYMPIETLSLSEAKVKYPSVCDFLAMKEA